MFPTWHAPIEPIKLVSDEVHVWRARLDQPPLCVESLLGTLTDDERSRAERFKFLKDREHFIVARGTLRAIIGRYLQIEPSQLRFCYSDYGKPALVKDFAGGAARFNLTHSHGLALFAVTCGREVGIDLEKLRPDLADGQIAERFFSAQEVRRLRELPRQQQGEAFFNCWTRKEAYIKARGEGLSMPLDSFDVSLVPGEPAELLDTRGDPQEASRWSLRELFPASGFVAAVAVEGSDWRLRCLQWP